MDALLIAYFVLLCAALCFYAGARRKDAFYVQVIFIYLLLQFIVAAGSTWLVKVMQVRNNLYLFHVFTPLEYALLAFLYARSFHSRLLRALAGISIPVFGITAALLTVFVQPVTTNNSYACILESLLLILWVLCFLGEVLLQQQVTLLYRYPLFWISVGLLFYFTGSLLTEGLLSYLLQHAMALALAVYRLEYLFKYLLLL
ncbi:MAG TPA: hypothetical protein VGC22_00385, partial [Chitinophaga sp.]